MAAAESGDVESIHALLPFSDARAAMSASGRTALHIAAASRGDNADAVLALLPSSDPSARDAQDHTALMSTARNGAANCIGALLPLSDARATDLSGQTALMLAATNVQVARACGLSMDRSSIGAAPRMWRAPNFSLLLPCDAPVVALRPLRQQHRSNDCQHKHEQRNFLIRGQRVTFSWAHDHRC
jgi:hypothetical protein